MNIHIPHTRGHDAGNALFLILIAVALFAALSYAVTQSGRGGGGIDREQAMLAAGGLVNHAGSLRQAVLRLRVAGGCGESQLNFANTVYKTGHGANIMTANASAPANDCDIYGAAGGITPYIVPAPHVTGVSSDLALPRAGHTRLLTGQLPGIGSTAASGTASANDLYAATYWLSRAMCLAINNSFGVNNPSGEPPTMSKNPGGDTGSYANGSFAATVVWSGADVSGRSDFCYNAGVGGYIYVSVLMER